MPSPRICFEQPGTWAAVRRLLEGLATKSEVLVPRAALPHPRSEGAVLSVGLPRGQRADWRFPAGPDCSGLHVHELADGWAAHLDLVHPACGLVPHLQADAPGVLILAGAGAGASVGLVAGRPLVGLVLGLLVGAAMASGGQVRVVQHLQATLRAA